MPTSSRPPLASTAARSHTQPQPTVFITKSEWANTPGTAFSSAAEYVCSGKRYFSQSARIAASSFFTSIVATARTDSGDTPFSCRNARKQSSRCAASVPRLQPTPSVSVRGLKKSVTGNGGRISRSVIATPTDFPASAAAETA